MKEKSQFQKLFIAGFTQLNIEFNEEIYQKFLFYLELLSSLKYNLTAIRKPEDIIIDHFFDSLSLLTQKNIVLDNKQVIDVGSGAGFPLVPLKIVHPNMKATGLDRKQKSIVFLEKIVQTLNLPLCHFVNANVQELKKQNSYIEQYDYILTRAVGSVEYLIKNSFFLLKRTGVMILYKGPNYKQEISVLKTSAKKKIEKIEVRPVFVPFSDKERYLIFVYKS